MALASGFCLAAELYDSQDFSGAFHALAGDGVAGYGSGFSLAVNGFTVTVSSGYAFAAGRWLENREPLALTIPPSGNTDDRTDAVAVRVDYAAKTAALTVIPGVDAGKLRESPALLRDGGQYCIVLYLVRVRRGATTLSPDDFEDLRQNPALCGRVTPLSEVSGGALRVYGFLTSGIDREVARVLAAGDRVLADGDARLRELDRAIRRAGGAAAVGEVRFSRRKPVPESEWLLCDGGTIPAQYPALAALLGGALPDISGENDRYRAYICGGTPERGPGT